MRKYLLIAFLVVVIPDMANALATCDSNRRGEVFVDTTPDVRSGKDERLVPLLCGDNGWMRLNSTVFYSTLTELGNNITGIPCGGIEGENALSRGLTAIIGDIDGNGNSGQVYCDGEGWEENASYKYECDVLIQGVGSNVNIEAEVNLPDDCDLSIQRVGSNVNIN